MWVVSSRKLATGRIVVWVAFPRRDTHSSLTKNIWGLLEHTQRGLDVQMTFINTRSRLGARVTCSPTNSQYRSA